MATICPTVTATDREQYQKQIAEIESFASRVHVDVSDGILAPNKLLPPQNVYWPKGSTADMHVMYERPLEIIETLIGLQPQLIIVHAESPDAADVCRELAGTSIRRGLAVLQQTPIDSIKPLLEQVEHVLIFSGDLGHFGGTADLSLLTKVALLKNWRADLEIGWDGGISLQNIHELVQGGVDVLNVGGAIHNSDEPRVAYEQLVEAARGAHA